MYRFRIVDGSNSSFYNLRFDVGQSSFQQFFQVGTDSGLLAAPVALNSVLDVNCALVIDRLIGLRSVDSFIDSGPAGDLAPGYFGSSYTDADGAHWQEINLQLLSQQPQFLNVNA